jgi:predicted NBD/HSP70 family sugar kinase
MSKNVLNAAEMKIRNQKKILQLLVTPCSRADLARKTGLTRAAISIIVDELINQRYIMEGDPILGKVGRKSFVLKLNPDRFYMIGVNLARDGCSVGIVNFCGEILSVFKLQMSETTQETLHNIEITIRKLIEENHLSGELLGIGITAPGPLDSSNGKILNPPNFEQWSLTNVTDYFRDKFDCTVLLENNSNALALLEKFYSINNQFKNYVELNVDSGIGSGVILNNQLYKGSSGFGNDFGHMSINFLGEPCQCGNIGCAELYASIPNILRYAKQINPVFTDWNTIVDQALSNNTQALQVIEKEAFYLSIIITNIMNILDVEAIIFTGDLTYHSSLLINLVKKQVNQQIIARMVKQINIISSSITYEAPVLSSANLILEHFLKGLTH